VPALLVGAFIPSEARADRHRKYLSAGVVTVVEGSTLWGAEGSFGFLFPKFYLDDEKKPRVGASRYGLFIDAARHSGEHTGGNRTLTAMMAGVTYQIPLAECRAGKACIHAGRNKVQPFVRVSPYSMVQVQDGGGSVEVDDWAKGPGLTVGLDVCLEHALCFRGAYDHIWLVWSEKNLSNYSRWSLGLSFRFDRGH
jgi:hypothetical protein